MNDTQPPSPKQRNGAAGENARQPPFDGDNIAPTEPEPAEGADDAPAPYPGSPKG